MACLAHDKRFRSSFHSIINELRNEKRIPVSVLRAIPMKCCTCHTDNEEMLEPLVIKEDSPLVKMQELVQRVNREKQFNPKLILSLHQFRHVIEENRGPVLVVAEPQTVDKHKKAYSSDDDLTKMKRATSSDESSSSSDSEDFTPMEVSTSKFRYGKKPSGKTPKKSKPIKTGTFLFLPYVFKRTIVSKKSDPLLEVAKKLQRQRFISRTGHFSSLEKQYDVRINMITPKTSQQVIEALENAKTGFENLTIHGQKDPKDMSGKQEGEWVLVRSKKPQNRTNTVDIEQLLDDLTNRWETCMGLKKRTWDESEDSDDDSIRKKK